MKTKAHSAIIDIPLFAEKTRTWCNSSSALSVKRTLNVTVNTLEFLNKRDYLKISQDFMSKTDAKTRRNLNQNCFAGVSSDKSFCSSRDFSLMVEERRTIVTCALQGRHDRLI